MRGQIVQQDLEGSVDLVIQHPDLIRHFMSSHEFNAWRERYNQEEI